MGTTSVIRAGLLHREKEKLFQIRSELKVSVNGTLGRLKVIFCREDGREKESSIL